MDPTIAPAISGDEATLAPAAPITGDDATAAAPIAPGGAVVPESLPIVERGHYTVAGEFARGGLGRILRAHDHRLRRTVAVKEMLSGDGDAAIRFVREAMVTARLQHPSIVAVYEAGRWPSGEPFYAMKMVTGRPLDTLIREATTLNARLALLPHLLAVCEAMAYAHGERVIHRDLKPQNVLVGSFGETVVIDWGLAKDLADASSHDATAAGPYRMAARSGETIVGAVMGTPAYMPPEQARGDRVDERADVYALGAMLYHTLGGRPPHVGKTLDEVLEVVLRGAPPSLLALEPGVPPDLAAIVTKAMAREPADRYPTAKEMADELRRFQTGQLVAAHRYSTWTLVRRWIRRHRAPLAVAAAAMVVIAALSVIGVRRILSERSRALVGEADASAARDEVKQRLSRLYEEQGRVQLFAGSAQRALVYLSEAFQLGDRPSLRFLLARALPRLDVRTIMTIPSDGDRFRSAIFSPDGKRLLVIAASRQRPAPPHPIDVAIVDASTGAVQVTLEDVDGGVAMPAFRGDGAQILMTRTIDESVRKELPGGAVEYVPHDRGVVLVWDATTGKRVRSFSLPDAVRVLAWADGGRRIVTFTYADGVGVWDDADQRIATYRAQVAAVSADGAFLLVGDRGHGEIRDTATLRVVASWDVAGGVAPHDAWFSRDGEDLYLADGVSIEQRYTRTGASAARWPAPTSSVVAAGKHVVLASDTVVTIYSEYGGIGPEAVITGHTQRVNTIDLDRDAGRVVTAAQDGTAKVWDAATGRLIAALEGPRVGEISGAWFSPDGERILTASNDGALRMWSVPAPTGYVDTATKSVEGVASWAWSPDGRQLAMASDDHTVGIWDAATGRLVRTLAPGGSPIVGLAWSPDGRRVVGASGAVVYRIQDGDAIARIWDVATGAQGAEVPGLNGEVSHVAWGRVVTEARDGRVEIRNLETRATIALPGTPVAFDRALTHELAKIGDAMVVIETATGAKIAALAGVQGPASAAFSPDGARVIVFEEKGAARVFDAATGRALVALADAGGWGHDPVVSPDGRAVAATDGKTGARVWDTATGALQLSAEAHTGYVTSVAWSADSAFLATTSFDRSAKIWDAKNGSLLASLDGHEHWVTGAAFSPDGTHLATEVARAWVIRIWDVRGETRAPADIAALVRCRVPLKLVEGRPLPATIDPGCR